MKRTAMEQSIFWGPDCPASGQRPFFVSRAGFHGSEICFPASRRFGPSGLRADICTGVTGHFFQRCSWHDARLPSRPPSHSLVSKKQQECSQKCKLRLIRYLFNC